jgi:acetyl-CoA carboxylase carboxyl transferase subunit beta
VIKETTHQDLPERFQTAEFLEEHGSVDLIVHRKALRAQLAQLLACFPRRIKIFPVSPVLPCA